jgi:cyclopropane fatty-acyl-phospholipid synthase-like methyltransferase
MSIYGFSKKVFRWLLPMKLRQKIWQSNNPLIIGLSEFKSLLAKKAKNDEIYDGEYFEKIDTGMSRSAYIIADSITREFSPKLVIDVGCGPGALLMELSNNGIKGMGLEYAKAALEKCRSRGLNVIPFDIESTAVINERADVAISTEVAEHLPADCAERYVDLLTGISNTVLMTAATPGQGGTDHVNEQPNDYWIAKFCQRDFRYEEEISMRLRQEWKERNTEYWYYSNVMVFTKIINREESVD